MQRFAARAASAFSRHGLLAIAALLVLAFVTGGSSRGRETGDALAQLAALPLLAWAGLALIGGDRGVRPRVVLLVPLAIVAVMALQQAPIPWGWWTMPEARALLASDLATAGVKPLARWSLAPLASERALWSLLPALAVFAGSLCLGARQRRSLLLLVVALGACSLLLGVLQMLVPRTSLLNPFPQWAPAVNGVFENPNHQASMLALCATIVASLPWRNHDGSRRLRRSAPAWFAIAAIALVAIPLTGSRAGIGLAIAGVSAALVLRAWRRRELQPEGQRAGARPVATAWRPTLVVLVSIGLLIAVGAWLRPAVTGSVRWALVDATAAMARDHAPLGAGSGTFTRWFDQSAPPQLVQWEYFNHAHDEYVQWWFELGVAGVACVLLVFATMAWLRPRPRRHPDGGFGIALASWLGCVLLLLHSLVDYVLRTPALMTIGALLAGVLVASSAAHNPIHRPGVNT